ncbi:MAG: hypothetical protein WDZ28_04970 [Simkaniaceae bacterium]
MKVQCQTGVCATSLRTRIAREYAKDPVKCRANLEKLSPKARSTVKKILKSKSADFGIGFRRSTSEYKTSGYEHIYEISNTFYGIGVTKTFFDKIKEVFQRYLTIGNGVDRLVDLIKNSKIDDVQNIISQSEKIFTENKIKNLENGIKDLENGIKDLEKEKNEINEIKCFTMGKQQEEYMEPFKDNRDEIIKDLDDQIKELNDKINSYKDELSKLNAYK